MQSTPIIRRLNLPAVGPPVWSCPSVTSTNPANSSTGICELVTRSKGDTQVGTSLSTLALRDGDAVRVDWRASSGGYIDYKHRENNANVRRIFNSGDPRSQSTKTVNFIVDASKPYVCAEDKSGAFRLVSQAITRNPAVHFAVKKFRDTYSGVKQVTAIVLPRVSRSCVLYCQTAVLPLASSHRQAHFTCWACSCKASRASHVAMLATAKA